MLSLHWIFYIYRSEMPQCCWLSIKLFPSCQFLLFSRYFRPFYYSKKYWIWSVQEIESFSFLMIASSIQPWTLLVFHRYNKLKSLCQAGEMRSRSENVILQFVKLTLINSSHYQPQVKIEQVVQCRMLYHIGDSELL